MHEQKHANGRDMYLRLAVMIGLSLIWMYAAMFAMVNVFQNVVQNINFVYMAVLMAGVMVPLEIVVMRAMYPDRRLNILAGVIGVLLIVASFWAIRVQAGVGDDQFLASMIPHHAGAILMCEQAQLSDPEIRELCFGPNGIVESQQREIEQMRTIIERLAGE